MVEIIEAINSALACGTNPVTAIRDAFNYSLEELAVTSGLATDELVALESGQSDPDKLARLTSSLGLPSDLVDRT